jgi:site-specific DNA-methyltransferase (adenine-specific)
VSDDCRLMLGDCLDVMPTLADGSIDLILADLPYGTTACKWDVVIPFEPMWAEFKRLLKPRGAVVLTAAQPFTSMLVMSNREWFRYSLVWDKVNRYTGFGNVSRMPLRRHEDALIFARKTPTYNPQMGFGSPYVAKRSRKHTPTPGVYAGGGLLPIDSINDGSRWPHSVLSIRADVKSEMGLHPTQKPVALMEYLIRTYSNEGETVLDPTMGSGTTGEACLNTGRRFIGMDNHPGYFATAESRLTAPDLPLLAGAS